MELGTLSRIKVFKSQIKFTQLEKLDNILETHIDGTKHRKYI